MSVVDIKNMPAFNAFGELLVKVGTNFKNSCDYAVQVVVPQAKVSGSPVLEAMGDDIVKVAENMAERVVAYQKVENSMQEYTAKISKVNSN